MGKARWEVGGKTKYEARKEKSKVKSE